MRLPIKPQACYSEAQSPTMISKRDICRSLMTACIGCAGSSNISGENSRKIINWPNPGKILNFFI